MARIDYVEEAAFPPEKRVLLETLSDGEKTAGETPVSVPDGPLNVYRLLGQNVAFLEGFRDYVSILWNECGLDPIERELVILTAARATDSAYIWHQHVRVAFDKGVPAETILAVSTGALDRLVPEHAALVTYVEAFVDGGVEDETHALLAERFDDSTVLGVGLLVGCYLGLARLFAALEIDLETTFVGWELENLS